MDDYGDKVLTLTQADVDAIAESLARRMRGPLWVDEVTHHDHHQWIEAQVNKDKLAAQSKRKIVESIVGAVGATGLVGALAYFGKLILDVLTAAADKLPPGP